ncbi:hypothetical protein DO97_18925 [Neosynechococcus sphagnicola sy1]|uniref:Uncharacterized protein n=1 Tax=Neosynechococcus sphagnicola sy1 TaxID=1497020 RepID=A0A098TML6_9CYAN|nr:hypothetical protein DO97_18925 [Neosynechococcus sphagnicola sy1]
MTKISDRHNSYPSVGTVIARENKIMDGIICKKASLVGICMGDFVQCFSKWQRLEANSSTVRWLIAI